MNLNLLLVILIATIVYYLLVKCYYKYKEPFLAPIGTRQVDRVIVDLINNGLVRLIKSPSNFIPTPSNHVVVPYTTKTDIFIGYAGVSQCKTTNITMTSSPQNSLFLMEPVTLPENVVFGQVESLDILGQIVKGQMEIRFKIVESPDTLIVGKYIGLCGIDPMCSNINVCLVNDLDASRFTLEVLDVTNLQDVKGDELIRLIYDVFSGEHDIRIRKGKGNHNSVAGSFIGLCGISSAGTVDVNLVENYISSLFRIQSEQLFRLNCCRGVGNTVNCGEFWGVTNDGRCDLLMEEYCLNPKNFNSNICSCINSRIPSPQCYDTRCIEQKGFTTQPLRKRCFQDKFVCQQLLPLIQSPPDTSNNTANIDPRLVNRPNVVKYCIEGGSEEITTSEIDNEPLTYIRLNMGIIICYIVFIVLVMIVFRVVTRTYDREL